MPRSCSDPQDAPGLSYKDLRVIQANVSDLVTSAPRKSFTLQYFETGRTIRVFMGSVPNIRRLPD